MTARIDSIYCFDYTKKIGYYDSLRNFALEGMTYFGLALSTPEIHVNSTPLSFSIPIAGSTHIREYAISQLTNLNEISKDLAVNSPKYFLICYFDGNERYFSYNEAFFTIFKIAFQYRPQESTIDTYTPTCALQEQASAVTVNNTSPTQTTTSHTTPVPSPQQYSPTHPVISKKAKWQPWIKLLVGIWVLLIIIISIVNVTKETADADEGLTPVKAPISGTILSGREIYDGSKITIHAASGDSCVVKLKNTSGIERVSFYVRAGDTVTIGVPAEYLYVYFASGDTWYGKADLFGSKTNYSMDDEVLDFTKHTCEYTLYPVNNGNFSATPINEEDFK